MDDILAGWQATEEQGKYAYRQQDDGRGTVSAWDIENDNTGSTSMGGEQEES